ncbi:VPLPA-CTERM sorting domain-containing protein [Ruegeria pomeroyi]|nr:VPLPA-CTERM sorting domain-containing protein [Ruegeria pomeroyi]
MTSAYIRSTLKAAAIFSAISVSSTAATAATYNYNQYSTGANLGVVTLAVLQANQVGDNVKFTLTNTGNAGAGSFIDFLDFNYTGALGSLNLEDEVDAWTITVGDGKNAPGGLGLDVRTDVFPNGSKKGLTSGLSTSWSFLGARLADFSFASPNSLVHIGGLEVFNNRDPDSTKYFATRGGGGGTGVIPLPAGMPLLLTGLGVFGLIRARRRKSAEG